MRASADTPSLGLPARHPDQRRLCPRAAHRLHLHVIAEEAGFVGAAVVLVLLAWLCLRALRISGAALDGYGALLAGGIAVWLDVQVTGIPLPFISLAGQTIARPG